MKNLFLLSLLLFLPSLFAFEESAVDFKFEPEAQFFDQVTRDLRGEIPNNIPFSNIQLDDEGTLHLKLQQGNIDLSSMGEKPFSLIPLDDNKIKIIWNFKNIRGNFRIRADWRATVLGVEVKKHEIFDIFTQGIQRPESLFQLTFEEKRFKLNLLGNKGFTFDDIEFRSTDSDVLTWILERIDDRVRDYLNEEIEDYFSGPKISKKFQEAVEDDLNNIENIDILVSEYATKLQARFNTFSLDSRGVEFKLDTKFLEPNTDIHPCAEDLANSLKKSTLTKNAPFEGAPIKDLNNSNPGTVKVSYNFVENIVENLSIYEADENGDGVADEPLFCFGYKDADHSGKVEEVSFNVLGKERKTKIKFWAYPLSEPTYKYQMVKDGAEGEPTHLVTATMKTKVKFGSTYGYPKLLFKNNTIVAVATMSFYLKVIPSKGLHMVPTSFILNQFNGKVYYKPKKWLPKIRLPFRALRKKVERELLKEIKSSLEEKTIIDEVIPLGNFKVKIRDYQLESDAHQMRFNVLYN